MNTVKIWGMNDGEKVLRDDLTNPNKISNSVWDGHAIRLFAARNETVAFQVIVEAADSELKRLCVDMSELIHKETAVSRIANAPELPEDPTHSVGRRIEVFTQHYLYVSPELSTRPQWFYVKTAPPLHPTGWIPDALIPANALPGMGGQPVRVSPRTNQGFWIDIYVPNDNMLAAGLYRGEVTVQFGSEDNELSQTIPVELQLYDFALPDENHTKTFVYANDVSVYFPETPDWRDGLRRMAHRHRFDLVGAEPHNKPFDAELMERYKPYLEGTFFSRENGYEGPGEGIGEQVFPIGMYGDPVLGSEPAAMQSEADKWVEYFDSFDWQGDYFHYLIDEPLPNKFEWIREQKRILRDSKGAGSRLPLLTTRGFTPEIEDAIDIWCAHKVDALSTEACAKSGDKLWFYNGYRPYHGSILLEAEAVDLRVNSWLRWRYNIDGYFIWHGTHWKHNLQGPRAHWHQNVFHYPVTFMYESSLEQAMYYGEGGVHWANGDGILFYPGREPFFCEQDRGINGPISSIRMKNLRRGIQDYEYLWLAAQNGFRPEADAIAKQAVPTGMSDTVADAPASWSSRGSDWDDYRRQAAELIASSLTSRV